MNFEKNVLLAVLAVSIVGLVTVSTTASIAQNDTATETSEESATTEIPAIKIDETTNIPGGFASIKTTQTTDYISILVTKNPEESAPPQPDVPIVIVPGDGENGTIVVPPPANETAGGDNNVTIIEPDGNVTQIEDGNVTNIDNGGNETVVITPPNENVTETPGNVTVIDPPPPEPPTEEECGCPPPAEAGGNETAGGGGGTIPPVEVIPAPGQNVTIGDNETVEEEQPPAAETGGNETATEEPAPQPLPPAGNETDTGAEPPTNNETDVIPIPPGSNVTTEVPIPPDTNITVPENATEETEAGEPTLPVNDTSSQPVNEFISGLGLIFPS